MAFLFQSKAPHDVVIDSRVVHTIYPDWVLWDCIPVELKAERRSLNTSDLVQIFNYLKTRNDRLGLVINMGLDRVVSRRFLFESKKPKIEANGESLVVTDDNEELIASAKRALAQVITTHGIGYGEEITKKLLMGSLRSQSLSAYVRPVAEDTFRGCKSCDSPLD